MRLEPGQLERLARELGSRIELDLKRDIQLAASVFGKKTRSSWLGIDAEIRNGDDAAAIRMPDGAYLLFAAEGMRGDFVAADPWFAGYSAVMVNLSDIAAMGGRPWAIVDVLFLGSGENARVLEGMQAASATYGVPIVGGHTARVEGQTALAAAVVGQAKCLIESHTARPGQVLVCAVDLRGSFRGRSAWNAATSASPEQLRAQLAILPELAESGLIGCGKDISNAGICGTLAMLLEASGCGAVLDLAELPAPPGVDPLRWLGAFPSFGFILAVDRAAAPGVCARFESAGITSQVVGQVTDSAWLELSYAGEQASFCNVLGSPLTGFGAQA